MQLMLRMYLITISPLLLYRYWRNSMKQIEDIHAISKFRY